MHCPFLHYIIDEEAGRSFQCLHYLVAQEFSRPVFQQILRIYDISKSTLVTKGDHEDIECKFGSFKRLRQNKFEQILVRISHN